MGSVQITPKNIPAFFLSCCPEYKLLTSFYTVKLLYLNLDFLHLARFRIKPHEPNLPLCYCVYYFVLYLPVLIFNRIGCWQSCFSCEGSQLATPILRLSKITLF